MTPDDTRRLVVVESPRHDGCLPGYGLFPSVSVANFKKYQEIALSALWQPCFPSWSVWDVRDRGPAEKPMADWARTVLRA